MSRWFSALCACLAFSPCLAIAEDSATPYQPPSLRQVCEAAPISDRPGGDVVAQAAPGDTVTIKDVAFDADGALYFQIDRAAGPQFVPVKATAHFCDFPPSPAEGPAAFLAPPNSCHLIAASRRTLDEVNAFVADHAEYLPQMTVFRAQNGWYAISLGMISTLAVERVLAVGGNIPPDAYCSDGANYFGVMDKRDGRFVEPDPPAPADPVARKAEAARLIGQGLANDDLALLSRSCLLGNADSCGFVAQHLRHGGDLSEVARREMIRLDLMGCMLGSIVACNNAMSDENFSVDITLFTALADALPDGIERPLLETELRKIGCDAGVSGSCLELALPVVQYLDTDPGRYLTALVSAFRACQIAGGYPCHQFGEIAARKYEVIGTDWPGSSNVIRARLYAAQCRIRERPTSTPCDNALALYMSFLESKAGDDSQRDEAAQFLRDGCEYGSLQACVYQSDLPEFFSLQDRQQAAAKAVAQCDQQGARKTTCQKLDQVLGADLPETRAPIRAKYEEYARACRTEQATDGSNPCRDALRYYGAHISLDDIEEPLALLRETCRADGKITGCDTLMRYYAGEAIQFGNDLGKAWPAQPQKAQEARVTGCIATLEAVGNCGSLGIHYEEAGDFAAADKAYALGCNTGMTAGKDQYYGQDRVCYWAAKNARNNLHDYANARRWFRYTCDAGEYPFACKFLGLMEAQAEGGPADPIAATRRYGQACDMVEDITIGDGQACLFFGRSLIANRIDLAMENWAGISVEPVTRDALPESLIMDVLTQASRAFIRGCADDVKEACTAFDKLLADWARGDYPRFAVECRVEDAQGRVISAKTCNQFSIHLPDSGSDRSSMVYVWSDGDRTVLSERDGDPQLNDATAETHRAEDGARCLRNLATGRSFCANG